MTTVTEILGIPDSELLDREAFGDAASEREFDPGRTLSLDGAIELAVHDRMPD